MKKNNLLYYGVIVVMIDMEIFHVQKLPMKLTWTNVVIRKILL